MDRRQCTRSGPCSTFIRAATAAAAAHWHKWLLRAVFACMLVFVFVAFEARSIWCAEPVLRLSTQQKVCQANSSNKHKYLLQEPTHEPPRSPQPDKPKQTTAAKQQPYDRLFNFSAGPAVLPLPVLERAQAELLNYQVQLALPAGGCCPFVSAVLPVRRASSALHRNACFSIGSSPHALHELQGSGSSVMEMSHRGKEFTSIINKAEADLRQLLSIPDNYEVCTFLVQSFQLQGGAGRWMCSQIPLAQSCCIQRERNAPRQCCVSCWQVLFMQGGASAQFAAVPLNLTQPGQKVQRLHVFVLAPAEAQLWGSTWCLALRLRSKKSCRGLDSEAWTCPSTQADHIVTGSWSKKAAQEAGKYCTANTAAKGDNKSVPSPDSWQLSDNAAYVHYCDNETIQVGHQQLWHASAASEITEPHELPSSAFSLSSRTARPEACPALLAAQHQSCWQAQE
jgi:hypothetical protein